MLLKTISALATVVLLATSATGSPILSSSNWKLDLTRVSNTKLRTKGIFPVKKGSAMSCEAVPTPGKMFNDGGRILEGNVSIYYIFYGKWTEKQKGILEDLSKNIGGSNYSNIETTYGASGEVHLAGSVDDNYSLGKHLSDDSVASIVNNTIKKKLLPLDTNGVYFVLTSSDVIESGPGGYFCGNYCGYHNFSTIDNQNISYAFVGNPATCLEDCSPCNVKVSPNDDPGVDAMVSVITHEMMEAISDPELNAWQDAIGYENADKCIYTYGNKVEKTKNGAKYNIVLGNRKYLIQQNWDAKTQKCAMSAPPPPK